MKIVKLNDGSYAIRRISILGYEFFKPRTNYWCGINLQSIDHKMSEEEAKSTFDSLKNGGFKPDIGVPIKK